MITYSRLINDYIILKAKEVLRKVFLDVKLMDELDAILK